MRTVVAFILLSICLIQKNFAADTVKVTNKVYFDITIGGKEVFLINVLKMTKWKYLESKILKFGN